MVRVATIERRNVSSKDKKAKHKFDPKRIEWGWKLLGGAFGLWLVGLILNPVSLPMKLWIGTPLRLFLLWGVAFASLAAAVVAAVWLYPVVRRRTLRMRSLALMIAVIAVIAVIAMSTLYHLKWLTILGN